MEKFEVVYVRFKTGLEVYSYKHTEQLEIGTQVIVDAPSSGYTVVEVTREPGAFVDIELDDNDNAPRLRHKQPKKVPPTKWIVCVVDDSAYQKRVADEERAKEIKATLNQKLKEIEEFRKYEFLRQYDPEAAAMMEELAGLQGITVPTLPAPATNKE